MNRLPRFTGLSAAAVVAAGLIVWPLLAQETPQTSANSQAPAAEDVGEAEAAEGAPSEVAGGTAEPAEAQGEAGRDVVAKARENLVGKSLETELVESIRFGRRRFEAVGRYLQGQNLQMRLEFAVKIGDTVGTLLEVCDGQMLWSRQQIGEAKPKITVRDVHRILSAANAAGPSDEMILRAELGLGGLPALLAAIEQNMDFDPARRETVDGKDVIVVDGRWNQAFVSRWQQAGAPDQPAVLPPHVPDGVRLYFDSQLIPRRIVYLKKPPDREIALPMLSLDFRDIRLNPPIEEGAFQFKPDSKVYQEDVTDRYIDRLTPVQQ
ncbi:MAG: hypothetical protein KY476_25530 [Planctomycetes bacterium]|nr:hypothetical protein [Planctomycetota bacterium]